MYRKLRTLRKVNELTLKQLSEMTTISKSYLWQIEKGNVPEIKNKIKSLRLDKAIEQLEREAKKALNPLTFFQSLS